MEVTQTYELCHTWETSVRRLQKVTAGDIFTLLWQLTSDSNVSILGWIEGWTSSVNYSADSFAIIHIHTYIRWMIVQF